MNALSDTGNCFEYDDAANQVALNGELTNWDWLRLSQQRPSTWHQYVGLPDYAVSWARAGEEIDESDLPFSVD